jgi:ABC-2 type transport system ATP-binding protein
MTMNDTALEIRGLVKTFKAFKLGPIDLTVPKGKVYGYIGPNGAGKTTTIDLIMGMGSPDTGTINVLGYDHKKDEVEAKLRIGYVSTELNFMLWIKVGRLLKFYRRFYPTWDDTYCEELLENFNIGWNDDIGTLSFGAKTKLALITALSHRPELLLLDEPQAGLDAPAKRQLFEELLDAVQDEERTVLISSHNLDDIERFADHIGVIHEGKLLYEGATNAIQERFTLVDCAIEQSLCVDAIPGAKIQSRSNGHCRILADSELNTLERLQEAGASCITPIPVTLEELFIALVQKERVEQ